MKHTLTVTLLALFVIMAHPAAAQQPGSRYEGPPPEPSQWPAPTHYIAPQGDDSSAGTSSDAAWQSFDYALAQLRPGDVLGVMDGTYTPETTGLIFADCGNAGTTFNGVEDAPVTIRAVNERQPLLKSDGLIPAVWITRCRNWNVLGLTAVGADRATEDNAFYNATTKGMEPVYVLVGVHRSRNVALKRMLAMHSNRLGKNGNNHVYAIENSSDVLVEESEVYEHHRHGMIGWRSERVTFRRNYVNPRGHHQDDAADEGLSYYRSSLGLMENNIIEGYDAGFHSHGGDTYSLRPGGSWNHFLGDIALSNHHASRIDARRHPYPQSKPAIDNVVRDFVAVNVEGGGNGLWYSTVVNAQAENVTAYSVSGTGFLAGSRSNPPCSSIGAWGGCSHELRNALVWNSGEHGIWNSPSYNEWHVSYANSYNNAGGNYVPSEEAIDDNAGHIQHSMSVEPTQMGLEQGECIVFVPEGSNMKGAGEGGADIGANILYRYEDGELTDEPLWDPQTGAFPHGAVVDSINGVAGNSAFDVHKRLNVNTNGCTLPYSR